MRAFLFPGQGSQYVGMGRALAERHASARRIFEEADEILGYSLSQAIREGPPEALTCTDVCQPALLCVEIATLRVLEERGVRADALLGHSLGEYSALVATGALTLDDGLRIVALRGRLMREVSGRMCAVSGVDAAAAQALCDEVPRELGVAEIAAYNGPQQLSLGGPDAAIEELLKRARARRISAVPLATSGPFHTSLMRGAADGLKQGLDAIQINTPRIPYVANCDARWVRDGAEIAPRLAAQVHQPVRFVEGVRRLAEAGVVSFVEVGPGATLRGLVRRIRAGTRVHVTDAGRHERALELAA